MGENLLTVKNLTVHYITEEGIVKAVNGLNLQLKKGEILGLVGESGAGKTTTALSIMRLVPDPPGEIISGEIFYNGQDLLKKSTKEMRKIRGSKISMIFQDPMTSLNPLTTVGEQIAEVIRLHEETSKANANIKAQEMLELVGIPNDRFSEYPHQFSGGMKQRVIIAIALACNPTILLADEPTTALDVTIQAQILDLVKNLQKEFGTSMILITHDLGVVAEICDKVAVTYAGEIIEYGTLNDIYNNTKHPYTIGLFGSIPILDEETFRLSPIPGAMPDPTNLPSGCKFSDRCPKRVEICQKIKPNVIEVMPGHTVMCHLYDNENINGRL